MQDELKKGTVQLESIHIENETFYKISNVDKMRPFFMSIVSDSNHWMFIGSNGGVTAGRKNAEYSLFPYYTDDKIIESAEITGSKSIFVITKEGTTTVWEPFSIRNAGMYALERNVYKNIYGNKVLFEEVNHDLKVTFQYQWCTSNTYGFIKKSNLINNNTGAVSVVLLDGIQNIIPYGVGSSLQNQVSNLVDAYKRNELVTESGVGIFALSAIIVDKAEPSEALKATIAWSLGFDTPKYLLSSLQLDRFRNALPIQEEADIKAEKGAYFVNTSITLPPSSNKNWMLVANVNQSASDIVAIAHAIRNDQELIEKLNSDIAAGTNHLIELNAAADALQLTNDTLRDTRHFSNTLFNIMRGGIFDANYQIEKNDFIPYIANANKLIFKKYLTQLNELPLTFSSTELYTFAAASKNSDLARLCIEYLPLKFSRRHGDPSRPWNQFSINTHNEIDGSKILNYEGNWRDIFQNWEALAHSYPEFVEGMIYKFLNASTFDGYNPYRITKNGIDWERIEHDDPWSYIGYWGDHQIIYLLKFLEFIENHNPGKLESYFNKEQFVYANVPYKIKPYADILKNPKDTIEFDESLDAEIKTQWQTLGADSALLKNKNGELYHVNFIEKILATVLAKMSNFIPEGGIWMNTQRPEWNDANNALVGNGVSMVTLYYLRRFFTFLTRTVEKSNLKSVLISKELKTFFDSISKTLQNHQSILTSSLSDANRKQITDALGEAGSVYRMLIYQQSFVGQQEMLTRVELQNFIETALAFLEHSIRANKRHDHLFHAYNLMTVKNEQEISISYLSEMLEGQVAVLSSGYLSSSEALQTLDALKSSSLFREDQYSYILYPNTALPGFLKKNTLSQEKVLSSELLSKLDQDGDTRILQKDVLGQYHFNGNFKNANDLLVALQALENEKYGPLLSTHTQKVLAVFEEVFNHKAFTGRSGTFYGYEGLGSIYWHMVSKLQLAVQECCLRAVEENENDVVIGRLLEHYYEINEGIGIHKSPTLYGAFPTDPYSHTPAGKGAQQPGMTGQVKEDILSRFGELGVSVKEGKLFFNPGMLRKDELLTTAQTFLYVDVLGKRKEIPIQAASLCFTYCQIPIVYTSGIDAGLEVVFRDGERKKYESHVLDKSISQQVFKRTGEVEVIIVHLNEQLLK